MEQKSPKEMLKAIKMLLKQEEYNPLHLFRHIFSPVQKAEFRTYYEEDKSAGTLIFHMRLQFNFAKMRRFVSFKWSSDEADENYFYCFFQLLKALEKFIREELI